MLALLYLSPQIWDFASGRPLDMAMQETCSALTVLSDNDKVVFGRSDKFGGGTNIIVWDLMGNQAIKEMRYDAPVGNNDYISYINLSQVNIHEKIFYRRITNIELLSQYLTLIYI